MSTTVTATVAFQGLPWSPEWDYKTLSPFGDPDDGPSHGLVSTIKASSDTEAEERVLTYLVNNYEDDFRGAEAKSEGPIDPGLYQVRLTWLHR